MLFTAPQLASVVTVANSAEAAMPKRTSLPSMLPPGCDRVAADLEAELGQNRIAGLLGRSTTTNTPARNSTLIAANSAQPCRVSPTILPKV